MALHVHVSEATDNMGYGCLDPYNKLLTASHC